MFVNKWLIENEYRAGQINIFVVIWADSNSLVADLCFTATYVHMIG